MRLLVPPRSLLLRIFLLLLPFSLLPRTSQAYSVQTHEQLIDLAWKGSIVPMLQSRFPGITARQLDQAHAYAYGGCAVQDLGYYPFGHVFFSDLTHYVRPGYFVESLIRNAQTPDEVAFAIGALSHFLGDVEGHSIATNPSVAIEFPNLGARYGSSVTYADSPHAHVRTEFGFDVDQIAHHRFAPSAYLSHVGLGIAVPLLQRAFAATYGIPLSDVLGNFRKEKLLRSYNFAVRRLIPRIAYAEVVLHRKQMPDDTPGPEFAQLQRELAKSEFEDGWDSYRRKPGIGTHLLAGVIAVTPRIGGLSIVAIKVPTSATEDLYVKSLNRATDALRTYLAGMKTAATADTEKIQNRDLDTGNRVRPGDYLLTDETYARLVRRLAKEPGLTVTATLKANLLHFYADPAKPPSTIHKPQEWAAVQSALPVIANMAVFPGR